jgi:hypothetical protein
MVYRRLADVDKALRTPWKRFLVMGHLAQSSM